MGKLEFKNFNGSKSSAILEGYTLENPPEIERFPREIRDLLICIHEFLFEPWLNVKSVRNRCGIRNNNISSRFRYLLGKSIKGYIEHRRMAAAGYLLSECDLSVFDIAMAVGYNHVETFYQVFRRHFQCTPGEFRSRTDAGAEKVGTP